MLRAQHQPGFLQHNRHFPDVPILPHEVRSSALSRHDHLRLETVLMTRMYGPAVRRKRCPSSWR
jgi:hypothetical protein